MVLLLLLFSIKADMLAPDAQNTFSGLKQDGKQVLETILLPASKWALPISSCFRGAALLAGHLDVSLQQS